MTAAAMIISLMLAGLPAPKSPGSLRKLPPCARYAEWLDSQEQQGSFYDGLPETDDGPGAGDPASQISASLPFGYPDSVVAVLPDLGNTWSVSVAPSGLYVFLSDHSATGITVLRASTLETVLMIAGDAAEGADTAAWNPPAPAAMLRVHPRGDFIYITEAARGSVAVVSMDDGSEIARIPVGMLPSDMAFSPAGDRAYVACPGSGEVYVLE